MKKVWTTAYDVFSTQISLQADVDALLVGDSLGMTIYGFENTTLVTKELMGMHAHTVISHAHNKRVIVDIPYGSDSSVLTFIETLEFLSNIGAKEFKLELTPDNFSLLLEARSRGYTMVAHLGYLPQSSAKPKAYGKDTKEAEYLLNMAKKADSLGISSLVLECVYSPLAKEITQAINADVIGIGSGVDTDGQVLVFDDIIGKTAQDFTPRFLRRFADTRTLSENAMNNYVYAVKNTLFPNTSESYL